MKAKFDEMKSIGIKVDHKLVPRSLFLGSSRRSCSLRINILYIRCWLYSGSSTDTTSDGVSG